MKHKTLKSVWVFEKGKFVARRWVLSSDSDQEDCVSAPPMAAISAPERSETVSIGLSEKLSSKNT